MLQTQIKDKPFALLPSDVPCDIVKKWLATATHQIQQSQINKLNSIVHTTVTRGGISTTTVARAQNINNAYSAVVNLDYFPVTVTQLPIVNGVRQSPSEFLEHIRKNINSFVDTKYAEFEPYNYYGVDDRNLWNSNNPLDAVVAIDIDGPDNGSVIVSEYNSKGWTFSTIFDPKYGQHPVSGNRDFGYTENTDGSYTFYSRGVDRLTSWDLTIVQNATGIPFSQADALWISFQTKIDAYVKANGGVSAIRSTEIYRPNWDQVKAVLDGRAPLSTLSKDCKD